MKIAEKLNPNRRIYHYNEFTYLVHVFLLSSYCQILIYIYFQKNKYQIQSYMTFNMDDSKRSIYMKIYSLLHIFQLMGGFVSFLWEIQHFQIFFHVPDTFLWLLNYERYVHVFVSFRCIFLICSCHLSKHPLLYELFWYPSPDDGYWNRNVNVIINSPIWIMFFCCFHICKYIGKKIPFLPLRLNDNQG